VSFRDFLKPFSSRGRQWMMRRLSNCS